MTSRRGLLRCLIAAVLFGDAAPAASILAGEMPTLATAPTPPGSGLVGGPSPSPWCWVGHSAPRCSSPAWPASRRRLLLLLNGELVATLAIAAVVFRENLGRRLLVAAGLIGLAGILLVWQPGVAFDIGGLLTIGACVCWGIDNSVTARIDQLSPEQITFTEGAVAGTVNVILGLAIASASGIETRQMLDALVIGALGYGASINPVGQRRPRPRRRPRPGDLRRRPRWLEWWCSAGAPSLYMPTPKSGVVAKAFAIWSSAVVGPP